MRAATGGDTLFADQRAAYDDLPDAMKRRIDGMSDDEGLALLETLKAHAPQPKYRLSVRYGIGDVVMWDKLSLLHAATPATMANERTATPRIRRAE
jgi:alpha-ketoglutarate-dependent taurine dioxygenase